MKRNSKSVMASRNSKVNKNHRSRLILLLAAIFIAGGGVYLWFFTGVFTVRQIYIYEGTNLPVDSLSKCKEKYIGCNIFTIPLDELKMDILECPDVEDVVFKRNSFHRINCYLKARNPVAAVLSGELREVDENGVFLSTKVTDKSVDLPLITGITDIDDETGRKELKKALKVLDLFKKSGFSPAHQLSEIHVEGEEVALVWMGNGSIIRLGKNSLEQRVHKLKSVYKVLKEQEIFPEMIDLRFSSQVVIR